MNNRVVSIANPVRLMVVRQKDLNDRAKGYQIMESSNKWKDLLTAEGRNLTSEEIIKMAHRTERHILWNPILRRKQDSSIFERSAA